MTLQIWSSKREELRGTDPVPTTPAKLTGEKTSDSCPRGLGLSGPQPPPSKTPSLPCWVCRCGYVIQKAHWIKSGTSSIYWRAAQLNSLVRLSLPTFGRELELRTGLVSYGDYVIGYNGGVLRGEGDFYHLIEEHENKSLRLFVYNADFDVTREVVLGELAPVHECDV
jgi:hypothetical protein